MKKKELKITFCFIIMVHRSIIRIAKSENISKAGNVCLSLIIYFIILIVFQKYWIIINASFFGLIITGVIVIYCLKAISEEDSDESTTTSESGTSSESEEEIICQAEVILDSQPSYVITEEVLPTAPPLTQQSI